MKKIVLFLFVVIGFSVHAQIDLHHWAYLSDTNETTYKISHSAILSSNKMIQFKLSADDSCYLELYVLNVEGNNQIWLRTLKGFIGDMSAKSVKVSLQFDNEQPKQYTFYTLKKVTNNKAYLDTNAVDEIIEKLKRSKMLKIVMTGWNTEGQIAEYNVAGLKWDYKNHDAALKAAEVAQPVWKYYTDTDKMTSALGYNTFIIAKEKLSNGAKVGLDVTNLDTVNYVAFYVKTGKFMGALSDSLRIRIRFDEEQPEYRYFWVNFSDAVRGRSIYLEYKAANEFIKRLKTAKRLRLQADFEDDPSRIVEFNVAGLKWNHKGKETEPVKPKSAIKSANSVSTGNNKQDKNLFDKYFESSNSSSGSVIKTTITTTTSDNSSAPAAVATSQVIINGAEVDTRELIDDSTHTIKLHCVYKNTTNHKNTITIKAYFLDANGNEITEKTAALSCSGNAQTGTELDAAGIFDKYKSYRIEIQ